MRFLAVILIGLFGCKAPKKVPQIETKSYFVDKVEDTSKPCPEEAGHLALDRLFPQLGWGQISNYLDVWVSGNYEKDSWGPTFRKQQKKLDRLRSWANTISNSCARDAYNKWLDYYQNELDSARSELESKAFKKEMDNYNRTQLEQETKMRKYASAIDGAFPNPPAR